jgi:hypothetical protein
MINNIKNNKLKGWEFMKCGRQEGDIGVDHLGVCPAYRNRCATVVGTFCDLVQVMYAKKHTGSENCPFFNSEHFDKEAKRVALI